MNLSRQPPWLDTSLGAAVLELEARICADALADVFGFELLQIGGWGGPGELVAHARTQHRCSLAPDASGPGAIRTHFDALPIATASVEAVLLPHTLEHGGAERRFEPVLLSGVAHQGARIAVGSRILAKKRATYSGIFRPDTV